MGLEQVDSKLAKRLPAVKTVILFFDVFFLVLFGINHLFCFWVALVTARTYKSVSAPPEGAEVWSVENEAKEKRRFCDVCSIYKGNRVSHCRMSERFWWRVYPTFIKCLPWYDHPCGYILGQVWAGDVNPYFWTNALLLSHSAMKIVIRTLVMEHVANFPLRDDLDVDLEIELGAQTQSSPVPDPSNRSAR